MHVVDFDYPEAWEDQLKGDVLFSCMGTTIKAAGTQEVQWKVDYTYQFDAAKAAKANGVSTYAVAAAMIRLAKSGRKGIYIIDSQDILKVR